MYNVHSSRPEEDGSEDSGVYFFSDSPEKISCMQTYNTTLYNVHR